MNDTNIPVVYRYKYYYCTYDVFNSCFSFYMRHQFITEMQLSKAGTYMFLRSENQFLVFYLEIYIYLSKPDFDLRSRSDCPVKLRHVGSKPISLLFARDRCIRFSNKYDNIFISYFDLYLNSTFLSSVLLFISRKMLITFLKILRILIRLTGKLV